MAWCRQATSHYLSQCWPKSMRACQLTSPVAPQPLTPAASPAGPDRVMPAQCVPGTVSAAGDPEGCPGRWAPAAPELSHGSVHSHEPDSMHPVLLDCESERGNAGTCITTAIWCCHKTFGQWQRSFHWKLRCHWLKGLRRQIAVVIQGPRKCWRWSSMDKHPPLHLTQWGLDKMVSLQMTFLNAFSWMEIRCHMALVIIVNIGSGNGLSPFMPEPILTYWHLDP